MLRKIWLFRTPRAWMVGLAAVALLAGVSVATRWPFTDAAVLWLSLPMIVFSWRRQNLLTLAMVVVVFFGVGLWRGSVTTAHLHVYRGLFGRTVTVVGTAATDGSYGSHEQQTFTLAKVRLTSPFQASLVGTVNLSGFGAGMVHRGDFITASGKLKTALGGAQGQMSFAQLRASPRPPGFLEQLRRRFAAGVQSALPEPLASFGLGLLVGQRNTLPVDVSHMLLVVGLTHIIAVSGYNLTIILRAVRRLAGKRSKFQTAALCAVLVLAFWSVAGASPSLTRAAFVSGVSLLAWYYGRAVPSVVLLLVTAAVTACANPLYLWGNASWYLSFLAFAGVMVLAPLVSRRLFGGREPPLLITVLLESFCAEAMTLPYVLHEFGQMSLVGLPANVLVVALVPLAMLLTLVAGLAGMFAGAVGGWFAWPARLLLGYMLDVSDVLSRIPHSFVQNRSFSTIAMLAAYAILASTGLILWHSARRNAIITEKKLEAEGVAGDERTFQMVYD